MDDDTRKIARLTKAVMPRRYGLLEVVIIVSLAIALTANGFMLYFIYNKGDEISATTKNTNQTAKDVKRLAGSLDKAQDDLNAKFDDVAAALRALDARLRAHDARQQTVIIRGGGTERRDTVIVVQPEPSPQPTATVTCDPTPIIGNCRRGRIK